MPQVEPEPKINNFGSATLEQETRIAEPPVELLYDPSGHVSVLDHVEEELVAGCLLHRPVQVVLALEQVHQHAVVATAHLLLLQLLPHLRLIS